MSQAYTYSVANDTANGALDSNALIEEIETAALGQTLEHVARSGDVLSIQFAAALSGADETELDGVVAAHAATKPAKYVATPDTPYGRMVVVDARQITTNTATPKVVYSLVLAAGEVAEIRVRTQAKRLDSFDVGYFERVFRCYKNGANNPVIAASIMPIADIFPALSGWDIDAVVNAGDQSVRVRATGNASHEIRWITHYEAWVVGTVT